MLDRAASSIENLEPRWMFSTVPSPQPLMGAEPPAAAGVRSVDGTGNNLAHLQWGSTGQALLRLAPTAYGDGISSPAGANRPSARAISNAVSAHGSAEIPSATHLSAYAYLWGQFVDHDIDLTSDATPAEPLDVAVPQGDAYFDPTGTGTQTIGFNRSEHVAGTGDTTPRQQPNDITAFLDGSMIYGCDATRAAALRSFVGGRLKTSDGNLLPFNTAGLDNATEGAPDSSYFLAGDVRANENIELTSMQTLFMREHNRIAAQVAQDHPGFTDEQIYQQARKMVIAEIQSITYNEFLPALLGPNALAPYTGYKPDVNPGISNEFSTAAFRLGHSMLPDDVEFLDNSGNAVRDPLPLAQAFFNPSIVSQTGVDPILKYLASSNSEEIDTKVVDGLRNFLFGQPGQGGFDLVSLNIQRGRDHGLSDYNTTRAALGLPRVTRFDQITSDPSLQQALKASYGTVDNIDLWVGGLAEDHLAGSNVGPTFQRILVDQFTRLRDGDRFWYQRSLNANELRQVQNTHLADIVRLDSGVSNLQDNVFVYNPSIGGRVWEDRNGDRLQDPTEPGLQGREVDLLGSSGQVLQMTHTDAVGHYSFSGMDLGQYQVRAETPAGWQTSPLRAGLVALSGGFRIDNISFAQQRLAPPPPQAPPAPRPQLPPPPQHMPPPPAGAQGSPQQRPNGSVNDPLQLSRQDDVLSQLGVG